MKAYLRIKIKSLGAEIRMIRQDTLYWRARKRHQTKTNHKNQPRSAAIFWGLRHHADELSQEVRCALLAYGFLRGRRYDQIERNPSHRPNAAQIARITDLVMKYGEGKFATRGEATGAICGWTEAEPLQKQAA